LIEPPSFASAREHLAHLGDVEFWRPYISEALGRHDLCEGSPTPVAGFNPTYPTFLVGDVVVKFFGGTRSWREVCAAEGAAQTRVGTDPAIGAPRLLAQGVLYPELDATWPYLVTTRMHGVAWHEAALGPDERTALAAELGEQIGRVHRLAPRGVATDDDWRGLDIAAAAEHSSLPPHLVAEVDAYLAGLEPFDRVFVHGDLVAAHVFVEDGRLAGIIDWGDAMVADRHYELIQPYRDLFACDVALFRCFLEACNWPRGRDLPRQILGHALHRQAVGLAQHHTMDVFQPIAARFPLAEIRSLDDLATELFGALKLFGSLA